MSLTIEHTSESNSHKIIWNFIEDSYTRDGGQSLPLHVDMSIYPHTTLESYVAERNARFRRAGVNLSGYLTTQHGEIVSKVGEDVPQAVQADSGQVVPYVILSCWDALRKSGLSRETFKTLMSTAIRRETTGETRYDQISGGSLRAFLTFWGDLSSFRAEPEISVSPKGCMQAEWLKDDSSHLVMEFQPSGVMFFSLWLDGEPIEGFKKIAKRGELINMLCAGTENPFTWCES